MCSLSLEPTRALAPITTPPATRARWTTGTCLDNNTRHQDTVDDLGTRTDLDACEKYGVGDLTFYNTALSNESSVDHSCITDILWKRGSILSVDFPR